MKGVLKIAEYIIAVATIAGAALWLDAKFDAAAEHDKEQTKILEYVNTEQAWIAEDVMGIKDSLNRLENKIDKNSKSLNDIRRAGKFYIDHQEEYTKDQLNEIMDEILKKNGVSMMWIPPFIYEDSTPEESMTSSLPLLTPPN